MLSLLTADGAKGAAVKCARVLPCRALPGVSSRRLQGEACEQHGACEPNTPRHPIQPLPVAALPEWRCDALPCCWSGVVASTGRTRHTSGTALVASQHLRCSAHPCCKQRHMSTVACRSAELDGVSSAYMRMTSRVWTWQLLDRKSRKSSVNKSAGCSGKRSSPLSTQVCSTVYAWCIALNCSCAAAELLFLSGCLHHTVWERWKHAGRTDVSHHCSASFLYALFSCLAVKPGPCDQVARSQQAAHTAFRANADLDIKRLHRGRLRRCVHGAERRGGCCRACRAKEIRWYADFNNACTSKFRDVFT
jgi:hypothetical protein